MRLYFPKERASLGLLPYERKNPDREKVDEWRPGGKNQKAFRRMKKQYRKNKAAKVGDRCICPSCNTLFVKVSYQQAFCKTQGGTVCKDKYWNTVTPEKETTQPA